MMKYACLIVAAFVVACAAKELSYYNQFGIYDKCVACICEGASGCNMTTNCNGQICGPFRITGEYWKDAGSPIANGDNSAAAYITCVLNSRCAASAVQNYLDKFKQDCNGDGVVDCEDFARIHVLGGYGCQGNIPEPFSTRFHQCLLD